jgi:CheY-like chemotaxis protein/anti-sigma regulatory factor (Ser/Thr protein kinase)
LQTPAFVLGDAARLAQCVANLLQNAAKYTPPGGLIQVEVAESGARVSIAVRDNGAGIAPALLPQLFELFVQSEDTLAHSRGGLGIGLAIVKRIIEMHGGSVEAASDGGGAGSTFTIHLWRLEPAQAPARLGSAAAAGKPKRILVVDASPDGADTVAALLSAAGHRVDVAYSALSGLAAAERLRPDAVVIDLDLPRISGYEVARRLRAQPDLRSALIVGLSGSPGEQTAAGAEGIDHRLSKPVDIEALRRALD